MGKFNRAAALSMALVLLLGCLSAAWSIDAEAAEINYFAAATQDRSQNFNKNYVLTGNYADDLVAVARAQIGRTTYQMQYSEDWCANFVNDCARLTGMPDSIIPYNYSLRASCKYLYNYMINNCNAKVITDTKDVQSGDIVFYYCPSSDFYLHVGIVASQNCNIEGNYNEMVCELNFGYNYGCYIHTAAGNDFNSGHVKRIYVRPNYNQAPAELYTSSEPDDHTVPTRELAYSASTASSGQDVSWVQSVLAKLGYNISVTGRFDKYTETVVKKFQTDNGLKSTGVVDETTRKKLVDLWQAFKTPAYTDLRSNKTTYEYTDTISLSLNVTNGKTQKIVIESNGKSYSENLSGSTKYTLDASSLGVGKYTAYFTLSNDYKTISTSKISFEILGPRPTSSHISSRNGTSYTPTVIEWTAAENTDEYEVTVESISSDNDYSASIVCGSDESELSLLLPSGVYKATVTSQNDYFSAESENTLMFKIAKGLPLDLGDSFYAVIGNDAGLNVSGADSSVKLSNVTAASGTWLFTRQSDGSYVIKNCCYCTVLTADTESDTVFLSDYTGSDSQSWYIGGSIGSCIIKPKLSSTSVLNVENSDISLGEYSCAGSTFEVKTVSEVHKYEVLSSTVPTCTEDGEILYECVICGEQITKTLGATGHNYKSEVSEPTETAPGYTVHICKNCGDTYIDDFTGDFTVETADIPDTQDTPDTVNTNPTSAETNSSETVTLIVGDVNNDGKVTTADALLVQRYVADADDLNDLQLVIGDTNSDGNVDQVDFMNLLRYVSLFKINCDVGKITYWAKPARELVKSKEDV